jgi:hypothetical protein
MSCLKRVSINRCRPGSHFFVFEFNFIQLLHRLFFQPQRLNQEVVLAGVFDPELRSLIEIVVALNIVNKFLVLPVLFSSLSPNLAPLGGPSPVLKYKLYVLYLYMRGIQNNLRAADISLLFTL